MYCARCGNQVVENQKCIACETAASLPRSPHSQSQVSDEKTFAVACHLSSFAGFVFPLGSILGPLLVWLSRKNESKLVDEHGKAALNFQLSWLLWMVLLWVAVALIAVAFVLLGLWDVAGIQRGETLVGSALIVFFSALALTGIAKVAEIVLVILAAHAASQGNFYKYPASVNWVR